MLGLFYFQSSFYFLGPKCPQLFKFKLREFASLARIILFPHFRSPELAKSPRRNPKEKVSEANPISVQQDARSGFVRQVRRIQARRRPAVPGERSGLHFSLLLKCFTTLFTFIKMFMHVHIFFNLFRGCRALYDIYFSMLIGLLNHHSCYDYDKY